MDYIRNSKNRKLKTQILQFFSRITFWSYRLGTSWKGILFCNLGLLVSLFFPWMRLVYMDGSTHNISAFSSFTGFLGYGIIVWVILIWFFLLSHSKKEHLRAYVPFRLSDAQAIVFINSIMLTALIHFLLQSLIFQNFATQIYVLFGCKFFLTLSILLIVLSYFFSKSEKETFSTMSYLDKKDGNQFDEYKDIIEGDIPQKSGRVSDKNMTLPI